MAERRLKNEWETAAFNRETNEWDKTTLSSYENIPDVDDLRELIVSKSDVEAHDRAVLHDLISNDTFPESWLEEN